MRPYEYINSVVDPQLRLKLRWEKYLRSLKNGAWGDHIALQGVADMLGVTINVLCSHHPMVTVTPRNNDTVCEVFVGLLMQYHYVGLDTVPVHTALTGLENLLTESISTKGC